MRAKAADLQPSLRIIGNLQWTASGLITANYFVTPMDFGLRAGADKLRVKKAHEILGQNLPDDSLLLGLQAPLNAVDVLRRIVDDVDLEAHPGYADDACGQYDRVCRIGPSRRIHMVSFIVGKHKTAKGSIPQPDEATIDQCHARAAGILSTLDSGFKLTPVPASLFQWIWEHCLSRGVAAAPAPTDLADFESNYHPTRTVFRGAALDDGDQTGSKNRLLPSTDPVLVIRQPKVAPSYQVVQAVKSFPYQGMTFPGSSEFFTVLDGIDDTATVDWAMRIRRVSRDQVQRRNARALRRIGEQMAERDTEVSFAQNSLMGKVRMLQDYDSHIEANTAESEMVFTPVFAVGGADRAAVKASVSRIVNRFKDLHMELVAPASGVQSELWAMMLPGARRTQAWDDYAHIMPTDMWGGFVPFVSARVGHNRGPMFAVNLLSGHFEPAHLHLEESVEKDFSGSFACSGELGSGKSYAMKYIGTNLVLRGGQFLAIDRTKKGEYAVFTEALGRACGVTTAIIDPSRPEISLDPLRTFAADRFTFRDHDNYENLTHLARTHTLDTILPMLELTLNTPAGSAFGTILRPGYRAEHGIRSLLDAYNEAARRADGTDEDASAFADLARRMRNYVEDLPVLFDPRLDCLDMSVDATVVRTHNLQLPDASQLTHEHLFNRMETSKLLGLTIYELVATTARAAFLQDNGRFGLFKTDEAYHLTHTSVGRNVISEFVRDGRKHGAAIGIASHDPKADFEGVAHDLIPNRFAFRHTDDTLARNSLGWLGVDVDEAPHLVKDLRDNTSPADSEDFVLPERRGECFFRDHRGRIGKIKVLGPTLPELEEALRTTPEMAA